MRKCEYKRKYSPALGKYVYKHIYGEGIYDLFSGLNVNCLVRLHRKQSTR